MKLDSWRYLLLSVILWTSRTINAVVLNKKQELHSLSVFQPCYICAAEWKLRNSHRRAAIDSDEQAKLAEDEDKCEATVVREVEDTLKMMQPESWQNTAIDGFTLRRDTDRFLDGHQNALSLQQFRKKLEVLNLLWDKYRMQQDFNKWTALRQWLRLPALRRRLQVLEKDLKSEKQSRRRRRLLHRVQHAQKVLEIVKDKLRDVYAVFHREGKSQYSEVALRKRFMTALDGKLTQSRRRYSSPHPQLDRRYFPSKDTYPPRSQTWESKCNRLYRPPCW